MSEPTTVVRCPFCGHPYPMNDMQREVYRGRTMGCMNCGRPFRVDPAAPQEAAGAQAGRPEPGNGEPAPVAGSAGQGAGTADWQRAAGLVPRKPNLPATTS